MTTEFLNKINACKKTAIIKNDRRAVHFFFNPNEEMVEEYCLQSNILLRRVWKRRREIGGVGNWSIEIGDFDPREKTNSVETLGIKEDLSQPFVSCFNTKFAIEWRIRNLPYPVEVYSVKVDPEKQRIIVRTTNKKYYKELVIPELERLKIPLKQDNVDFTHKYNALIITYKKPKQLLDFEKEMLKQVLSVKAEKDHDVNKCNPT